MTKEENVFIKIQIEKSHVSNNFKLSVNFDQNAPNFLTQANQMYWSPSSEEMKFLMDMYEIVLKNNEQNKNNYGYEKEMPDPLIDAKDHEYSESMKQNSEPEYHRGEVDDVFAKADSEYTIDKTHKEEASVQVHENPNDISDDKQSEEFSEEKEVFVQINDTAIDDLLKKKKRDNQQDSLSYEKDKQSIDAILKKSKQKE